MPQFPHLPLRAFLNGTYNFKGFAGRGKSQRTLDNLENRNTHGQRLLKLSETLEGYRAEVLDFRKNQGLPDLPDASVIPLLLQVDPTVFDIESLKGFGIEVISEEENGFIIGASVDQFKSLREKIEKFINNQNQGAALLWEIIEGIQWRPEYILSEELHQKWIDGINDTERFIVDISIACHIKKSSYPVRSAKSEKSFKKSVGSWHERSHQVDEAHDALMMERQDDIQRFIELGGGSLIHSFVEYEDSFGFRAEISGLALKDIVLNYHYVFEIAEYVEIEGQIVIHEEEGELDIQIEAPEANSPKICVIDSGIQEDHRLLAPAILKDRSKNYVPFENTTADWVSNGGHGTKVAGAILYSSTIPKTGQYTAPFFLVNARILDSSKALSSLLFEPKLTQEIVDQNIDLNIFNLSVNKWAPCRIRHMSLWASTIDKICHDVQKIFVVSAGNLHNDSARPNNPGIKNHLAAGKDYPNFLLEPSSRIADPAQSLFAITVGSVCHGEYSDQDLKSFGKKDYPSSFSRTGFGIWGAIKPEVVEYGGDWIRERSGTNLSLKPDTSPELVKTGMFGIGRSDIGSSFSAPKVTHILAHLEKLFPNQSALFYKALLIQSARLPEAIWHAPQPRHLRYFGYGIPSLERAIDNTPFRITFTENGKIAPKKAKIFSVTIPHDLRRQGEAYDVLIEVSLCYTAEPRRTRKTLKSYLSSWVTWESSKLGQTSVAFQNDILKELVQPYDPDGECDEPDDPQSIKWFIWSNANWGRIKEVKRQANANQKDWVVLKSYELPSELSFAVVGHKGWENDIEKEIPYSFVVSFEIINAEVEIYELMQQVNVEVPVKV